MPKHRCKAKRHHKVCPVPFAVHIQWQAIIKRHSRHALQYIHYHHNSAVFAAHNPKGVGGAHIAAAIFSNVYAEKFPADYQRCRYRPDKVGYKNEYEFLHCFL